MTETEFDSIMLEGFGIKVETANTDNVNTPKIENHLRCFTCGLGAWRVGQNIVCQNGDTENILNYLKEFSSMRNGVAKEFINSGYSFTIKNNNLEIKDSIGNIMFAVATSAEVQEGKNDVKFVTPLKLREALEELIASGKLPDSIPLINPNTKIGAKSITFNSDFNKMILKVIFKDENGNILNPLENGIVNFNNGTFLYSNSYPIQNGLDPKIIMQSGQTNANDPKYMYLWNNEPSLASFTINFNEIFKFKTIEIISGVNFYSGFNNVQSGREFEVILDGESYKYTTGGGVDNPSVISL